MLRQNVAAHSLVVGVAAAAVRSMRSMAAARGNVDMLTSAPFHAYRHLGYHLAFQVGLLGAGATLSAAVESTVAI